MSTNQHPLVVEEAANIEWAKFLSEASFWIPAKFTESGWLEHAPFAFWLVDALKPRSLVELGTHRGYSFLCFCQGIKNLRIPTRAYAIDTWKGDEHAGLYAEEVFQELTLYHDAQYGDFSRLVRSSFDEALPHFEDGSIDLLHVDGRHFYQDVVHDFNSWRSKLSERAVILFHDINVRERGFGVFQLWEELAPQFPYFAFLHGNGLGVLGYGASIADRLKPLFEASRDENTAHHVRIAYGRLGTSCAALARQQLVGTIQEGPLVELEREVSARQRYVGELEQRVEKLSTDLSEAEVRANTRETYVYELEQEVTSLRTELERQTSAGKEHARELEERVTNLETHLSRRDQYIRELEGRVSDQQQKMAALNRQHSEADELRRHLNAQAAELETYRAAVGELSASMKHQQALLEAVHSSTSWRITAPARWFLRKAGSPSHNYLRRAMKLSYWLATPHRIPERLKFIRDRKLAVAKRGSPQ